MPSAAISAKGLSRSGLCDRSCSASPDKLNSSSSPKKRGALGTSVAPDENILIQTGFGQRSSPAAKTDPAGQPGSPAGQVIKSPPFVPPRGFAPAPTTTRWKPQE